MAAYKVSPGGDGGEVTIETLEKLNIAQQTKENKEWLDQLGGVPGLAAKLKVNLQTGLTEEQAVAYREKFGANVFPSPPMASWFEEFFEALKDPIVMILIAAAAVSLIIGIIKDPHEGWIEGTAIVIAVLLVGTVTATNNYNKERQFRSLEETAKKDDRIFIKRGGELRYVNPEEIVVGDLVKLKAGDGIPTDGVIFEGEGVKANESSLTGEPEDLAKHVSKDPFLLSSSQLMSQGTTDELFYLTIAVGKYSQWGKIRANLVTEAAPTPLQEKLEDTAKFVGKVGTSVSILTFIALVVMIWVHFKDPPRSVIVSGIVGAFIIAVTIIVVAIPEGLPLAVTISLAYSTKKMYKDNNLIRVLAACETMGNATNICSDKTGTLTENRMTVVEGWFGTNVYQDIKVAGGQMNAALKDFLVTNIGVNSAANIIYKDEGTGALLDRPKVIGSATEGALLLMIKSWGYDDKEVKGANYSKDTDKIYPFNSGKKRATAVILRKDGSVRILVKGATEWVLNDCTHVTVADGSAATLDANMRKTINDHVLNMADRALRTLCIAHRDFPSLSKLPAGWEDNPPDNAELICDGIVGIIDPLRSDVKDAVKSAQMAGVMVRMITGDNINTAKAIARDCGILTPGGLAIEGPVFRNLKPAEVDALLPRIQVMARSSPEDKYLMVTRLNGANLPKDEKAWLEKHPGRSWATEKDDLLPGYYDEWIKTRPDGGQVVGVTGDGTNDAPALKAADVGLSMGITGTQVAKNASDIVILDDKFSSIVRAIMWGRAVYDNIRKFLQFQLTVNIVALITVFVGAVTDRGTPLNAVMMLWVNLIMDTLGALALGTESPTPELLLRKPYKRSASLISKPMWRNIIGQAAYQLGILFFVLYEGPSIWGFEAGDYCEKWRVDKPSDASFDYQGQSYKCSDFSSVCDAAYGGDTAHCYDKLFSNVKRYEESCELYCIHHDYTHYAFIFNIFVMCQVFNEYNAREIFNNPANVFKNLHKNPMFIGISVVTVALQAMLVEVGGEFVRTTSLNAELWGWSILLGLFSIPLSALIRVLLPVHEDPESFFGYEMPKEGMPIPDLLKDANAPPGTAKVTDEHA